MYRPNERNGQAILLVKDMSRQVKDEVYRLIWHEHVKEDVLGVLEGKDFSDEVDLDGLADFIAGKYVYEGKYDCNQAYWNNLDALIDAARLEDFKVDPNRKAAADALRDNISAVNSFVKNNYRGNVGSDDLSKSAETEYDGPEL